MQAVVGSTRTGGVRLGTQGADAAADGDEDEDGGVDIDISGVTGAN